MVSFRRSLPSMVTMVTLACGLAAFEAARVGDWDLALRLILMAAVADGVDGTLARRLHASSTMGEQLDSLADIIAFGAAPAFLFASFHDHAPASVRLGVALAFALAGAYRLARFHSQPAEGVFLGLPITVAGPLLALTIAGPFGVRAPEAAVVGLGLAVLMVCHHPFPKFAKSRRHLLTLIAAAALPVALWPRVETVAFLAALAFGAYLVWGLIGRFVMNEKVPAIALARTTSRPHHDVETTDDAGN